MEHEINPRNSRCSATDRVGIAVQLGASTDDFGAVLLGFLERYGYGGGRSASLRAFDYTRHAVSFARGGVVQKAQVPAAAESIRQHVERDGSAPADRLVCEDPLTFRRGCSSSNDPHSKSHSL